MDIRQFEKVCKALSDPYRIKLLDTVRKSPEWTPCTDLLHMSKLAQSTVSHHLKQLVDVDLLHAEKDGRHIMYKINKETFAAYTDWLNRFSK